MGRRRLGLVKGRRCSLRLGRTCGRLWRRRSRGDGSRRFALRDVGFRRAVPGQKRERLVADVGPGLVFDDGIDERRHEAAYSAEQRSADNPRAGLQLVAGQGTIERADHRQVLQRIDDVEEVLEAEPVLAEKRLDLGTGVVFRLGEAVAFGVEIDVAPRGGRRGGCRRGCQSGGDCCGCVGHALVAVLAESGDASCMPGSRVPSATEDRAAAKAARGRKANSGRYFRVCGGSCLDVWSLLPPATDQPQRIEHKGAGCHRQRDGAQCGSDSGGPGGDETGGKQRTL